jgi:hypothetical protein
MDSSPSISNIEKMMSASLGAFVTSLVVTPLDVIKTRLQLQASAKITPKSYCCHNFSYCGGHVDFSFCPEIRNLRYNLPKSPLVLHGTVVRNELVFRNVKQK